MESGWGLMTPPNQTPRLFLGGRCHGQWIDVDPWVSQVQIPVPNPLGLSSTAMCPYEIYRRKRVDIMGHLGWVYVHVESECILPMLTFEMFVSSEGKKVCGD